MRKLAIFCTGFALAILLCVYWISEQYWLSLCLGAGGAIPVLRWIFRGDLWRAKGITIALVGGILGGVFLWGWSQYYLAPAENFVGRTMQVEGVVLEYPQETSYGHSILIEIAVDGAPDVTTLLYVDEQWTGLMPGDTVSTIAHLESAQYSSSGEEITYYQAKGILLQGESYGQLTWSRPEEVPLRHWPAIWSQRLKEGIWQVFSDEDAPLVEAVVTGNRDNLTDSFTTSLQRAGLAHVVAVSGMHMAFLAGALSLLLGRNRRSTSLILIPTVLLFMMVAGNTPSVVRASIMIIMLHIAPLFDREGDEFTSMSFALLLILLENPYAVSHVGLQLSFASVAGILWCAEPLQRWMLDKAGMDKERKRYSPMWFVHRGAWVVVSCFATSIGALAITTPLIAYYFGTVSLISPLSNLLTLWAISVVFAVGLVAGGMATFLVGAAEVLALCVTPFIQYLSAVIDALAQLVYAALPVSSAYMVSWLVCLYLVLVLGVVIAGKKPILATVGSLILLLCLSMGLQMATFRSGDYHLTVLNVGQGQSILLRMEEEIILVDCGGSDGEAVGTLVADTLLSVGITHIDRLILTHGHADHANGVSTLLERVSIGRIYLPDADLGDGDLTADILSQVAMLGYPVTRIGEETAVTVGDQSSILLYPPLGEESENERGLSALCTVGEFSILMTGDMGSEIEQALIATANLPQVSVFVAGHHGSKYSNSMELLEVIQPEIIIVSAGTNNSYGHPADEALLNFKDIGAEIYRTDLMGTVTISAGG